MFWKRRARKLGRKGMAFGEQRGGFQGAEVVFDVRGRYCQSGVGLPKSEATYWMREAYSS